MLIDSSYFTCPPRHILNSAMGTVPNPSSMEVVRYISGFIEAYQYEFLEQMLGSDLAERIDSYLRSQKDGVEPVPLYDDVCVRLRESFADYVFYHILADNTQATMSGLVLLKNANEYVGVAMRQARTWNRMVRWNKAFVVWAAAEKELGGITVESDMLTEINHLNI